MRFLKPRTAILLVPLVFLTGCSHSSGNGENGGGATTPEAAYEGFQAAMQKKDFNAGFLYLTTESQEALVGVAHIGPITSPQKAGSIVKETMEKMNVLDKYGTSLDSPDPNVLSNVDDKAACFVDLLNVMRKYAVDEQTRGPIGPETFADAKLTDLEIDGATAVGMAGEAPIYFIQRDGKWLIDLQKSIGKIRWYGTTFDITGTGGNIRYWEDRSEERKEPEVEH